MKIQVGHKGILFFFFFFAYFIIEHTRWVYISVLHMLTRLGKSSKDHKAYELVRRD